MWRAFTNEIFFEIRKRLPSFRDVPSFESGGESLAQTRFPESLAREMSLSSLRLALFYDEILEAIPWPEEFVPTHYLDIGSQHFAYAPALARHLVSRGGASPSEQRVTGIEVDPYRRYLDLSRRGDLGRKMAMISSTAFDVKVDYRQADWLRFEDAGSSWDLITCFFPFLFEDLHYGFGLTSASFNPTRFYAKIFASTELCLFFHQGEEERETALQLLAKFPRAKILYQGRFQENPWLPRKHPVFAFLVDSSAIYAAGKA